MPGFGRYFSPQKGRCVWQRYPLRLGLPLTLGLLGLSVSLSPPAVYGQQPSEPLHDPPSDAVPNPEPSASTPLNPPPPTPESVPDESLPTDNPSPPPPVPEIWQQRYLPDVEGTPTVVSEEAFDVYRLGPGDGIFVSVQRFPDLSFQATLDIQGNVIVPLEGAVNLAGQTLDEAQATILGIYDQYVYDPDVTLTLTAQRPVSVTIVGEVARPGFYPLPAPRVSTALLTAGGSTIQADLREIQIQRRVGEESLLEYRLDLFTPLKAGESLPDIQLQDGDVISIPRLDPTRLDEYDRSLVASSTLAKPTITVRVLNYATGARGTQANFGAITLPNGSRFLDALTQAGVNPDLAAYDRMAILRFNPEQGRADTLMVDASAAVNGDLSQNIPLQENDVLVVNRNLLAQITYGLNTFTQPFRDVLGFLLFFDELTNAAENLFRP